MIKTNVLKFKKVTAVFMAMLLMILSFSYTANDNSNALNTTRTYKVYNATNGKYLRDYTLNSLKSSYNTRAIIGNDDRVIDWTKSGVVKILTFNEKDEKSFSTGFVVGEHTIATAAHCLYGFYEGQELKSISKILLFDNNGNVIKYKDDKGNEKDSITPIEYHISSEYINEGKNMNDYALITIKEDLSDYMCFGLGIPLDSFVNGETNATVSITGFPAFVNGKEVNTSDKNMMYTGKGKIFYEEGINEAFILCTSDISEGNSGGPIYITESLNGKTYYTVVGIITNGDNRIIMPKRNLGTRIDTNIMHFYKSNDNLKW